MLLIRAFRQLDAKSLRALCHWVCCDLFNKRDDVVRLCEYLVEHVHKSSERDLSSEALWEAVYPGKPFDAKQLRHVMSFLLEQMRQYIAWSEWQSGASNRQPYLLRGLRRRGMDQLFEKAWEQGQELAEEHPVRDARYHFNRYQQYQEQVEYTSRRERSAGLNLQPLPDALTAFYVSEMLRFACLTRVHQAVAGQEYRLELLQVILQIAGTQEMLKMPAVALYFNAYQMLEAPDDDGALERFKNSLLEHERRFSPEEMRVLYLMAINGCIRRMNAGRSAFVKEAFQLYRLALERGFLMENGVLSGFTYKNILRVALGVGEDQWAETFLEEQRHALHPRERDNLYRYNLAFFHFRRRDYTRALPLLQQVDLDDPLNNLDARRMLLQTYYQLEEWPALESLIQSFGAYLRRQKNLGYHRYTNENLLFYTKKLMETDKKNKENRNRLQQEIAARTDVAEKAWLLEQCART